MAKAVKAAERAAPEALELQQADRQVWAPERGTGGPTLAIVPRCWCIGKTNSSTVLIDYF